MSRPIPAKPVEQVAALTLTVGVVSATAPATNAQVMNIVRKFALQEGYAGKVDDNQALVTFAVDRLKRHMVTQAREHDMEAARVVAQSTAEKWE